MTNTKLNFFQRLFYSVTDFTFYQDVVKETTGKAIGYLFLLSLLISLITAIKPTMIYLNFIDTLSTVFQDDIPDFKLEKGELTVKSGKITFSDANSISVTKDQVLTFLPYLSYYPVLMVLLYIVTTTVKKLIGALFISILALIINAIMKSNLLYSEIFRVGIYAMTLPSLIQATGSFFTFSYLLCDLSCYCEYLCC